MSTPTQQRRCQTLSSIFSSRRSDRGGVHRQRSGAGHFAVYGALATVVGFASFLLRTWLRRCPLPSPSTRTARWALVFGQSGPTPCGRRNVLVTVILLMTAATAGRPAGLRRHRPAGADTARSAGPPKVWRLAVSSGRLPCSCSSTASSRRWPGGSWQTATMAVGIGTGMARADALVSPRRWRAVVRLGFSGSPSCSRFPSDSPGSTFGDGIGGSSSSSRPRRDFSIIRLASSGSITEPLGAARICLVAAGSLAFNTFFIFLPNNLIARHGAGLAPDLARHGSDFGRRRCRRPGTRDGV